jgi:hypothetical protein
VTIDELALEIQRALNTKAANAKGGGRVTCNHATIVRVLSEYVAEHELEMMRQVNAWNIERAKLEHRIKELEGQ